MNRARGIVAPIVNVPHGLSLRALTTTRPRPASAMTTMKRMARPVVKPATWPISVRAISASAGEHDAGDEPDEARRVAELRRQDRPDQRPGAGDGREVMAEEHPARRGVVVVAVVLRVRRRRAGVVEHEKTRGDEGAVVAIGDRQDAEDGHQDVERVHIAGL
jgi:hypothetical protein